jgi:hypothetical protein
VSADLDNLDAIYKSAAVEAMHDLMVKLSPKNDFTTAEILGMVAIMRAAEARKAITRRPQGSRSRTARAAGHSSSGSRDGIEHG